MNATRGAIMTAYYPVPTLMVNKCNWLITAPVGSHVVMTVTNIKYKRYGSIQFRDGYTMQSPLLANLLQYKDVSRTPLTFRSTSRYMLVWDLTTDIGFHARYRTEKHGLSKCIPPFLHASVPPPLRAFMPPSLRPSMPPSLCAFMPPSLHTFMPPFLRPSVPPSVPHSPCLILYSHLFRFLFCHPRI